MTEVRAAAGPHLAKSLPACEWRGVRAVAAVLTLGLLAVGDRYGYSRDELFVRFLTERPVPR